MKKEIADMWVDALRSGKYKQGKKMLKTKNNEFCCLGVLCDISGKGEWKTNKVNDFFNFDFNYLDSGLVLPFYVQKWAGMSSDNGDIKTLYNEYVGISFFLSELNDNGYSFEQIADIIEKHWEEL